MAQTLAQQIFQSAKFVLKDGSGNVQVENLKIARVRIRLTSRLNRHKRDDGTTIVDSRIILPTSIEVSAIVPDIDTMSALSTVINDRTQIYSITTRGLVFNQMMSRQSRSLQNSKMVSATPITVTFDQVLIPGVQPVIFSQPSDSTVIDQGLAILSKAQASASEFASSILSAF